MGGDALSAVSHLYFLVSRKYEQAKQVLLTLGILASVYRCELSKSLFCLFALGFPACVWHVSEAVSFERMYKLESNRCRKDV